jgi:hypothetical protein
VLIRQPAFADRAHVDAKVGMGVRENTATVSHSGGKNSQQPNDERKLKPHHRESRQADRARSLVSGPVR